LWRDRDVTIHFEQANLTDPNRLQAVEFGVGLDVGANRLLQLIPVDGDVQAALRAMAVETWRQLESEAAGPGAPYSPAEKYASIEYVTISVDSPMAREFERIRDATPEINATALDHPENMYCYFARFHSDDGRTLTGVRRASQFKGILRSRLIRILDDTLRVVEDDVFKLDTDFDVLVDATTLHVLRPSGLEFVGLLQDSILAGTDDSVRELRTSLPFVEFAGIETYARSHTRAARLLASIRSQNAAEGIDRTLLRRAAIAAGVTVTLRAGQLVVDQTQIIEFLEVIDRRRFELQLVRGTTERYRASSRTRVDARPQT
jgi:hypothetical protein